MESAVLSGIDHVAITVDDLEATFGFYDRLFGATIINEYSPDGQPAVRVVMLGGFARISIHQRSNEVELVARNPTVGSADICFRWAGRIDVAQAHLAAHGIAIIDGPSPRRTADGLAAHSIYFRDPDGNLIELMAAD